MPTPSWKVRSSSLKIGAHGLGDGQVHGVTWCNTSWPQVAEGNLKSHCLEMNRVQIPSAELGTRAMAKGTRSKDLVPAQPLRPLEPRVLNGCSVQDGYRHPMFTFFKWIISKIFPKQIMQLCNPKQIMQLCNLIYSYTSLYMFVQPSKPVRSKSIWLVK